jgi:hypothetical protein
MFRLLVQAGLAAVALYALAGIVFAVAFHRRGLARLDPAAAGGGLGFRLLITPGLVALWPVLLRKSRGKAGPAADEPHPSPRRLRALHALAWRVLAVVVPLLLAAALLARPAERPPSMLPVAVPPASR